MGSTFKNDRFNRELISMKKLIFSPFLFIPMLLAAQSNFMSLTLGKSSTLGEYGSMEALTDGFATSGIVADYSGAYFISKYAGFGGSVKYSSNPTDEAKIKKLLSQQIPSEIPSNVDTMYNTGFWKNVSVMAGPFFTLPAGNFNIDLYGFGGIGFVMPPPFDIVASNTDNYYSRTSSSRQVSWAFNAGAGFRYNLNDNYALRFHSDFFASSASMKIHTELTTKDKNVSDTEKYRTLIEFLSLQVGLVYRM